MKLLKASSIQRHQTQVKHKRLFHTDTKPNNESVKKKLVKLDSRDEKTFQTAEQRTTSPMEVMSGEVKPYPPLIPSSDPEKEIIK